MVVGVAQVGIWLRQAITKSKTIVSQLQLKLVSVNEILSKVLLAFQGNETIVQLLSNVRETYREIRMDLGKERRRFGDAAKNQQTKKHQQVIIKNYLEKVKMIQKLGPQILDSITENGRLIYQKVQQLQIDASSSSFLTPKLEFDDKLSQTDSGTHS